MPRKSAAQKALEQSIAFAKAMGIEVPTVEEAKTYEQVSAQKKEQHSLAMEGVLLSQHQKHPLAFKTCKRCNLSFSTNYCYVAYCSDYCRKEAFKDQFGVAWDDITPSPSFWDYEQPFIIPPGDIDRLYNWAKAFVRQFEDGLVIPAESNQSPELQSEPDEVQAPAERIAPDSQIPLPTSQEERSPAQANLLYEPLDLELPELSF